MGLCSMSSSRSEKLTFFFSLHGFFLWLLFLWFCSVPGGGITCSSAAMVHSLPGFEGPLPFDLETGYIGVGNSEEEDVQLFYFFAKSESNPDEDPLILWLTGGPCCSAFSGLIYEIGPLVFEAPKKDGSPPTLALNSYSWTKVANIIFLDLPVGSGFSYSTTPGTSSTDLQSCEQTYEFLRKWLIDHPEFISNSFYMAGDSYAGIIVPIITQMIINGNKAGMEPFINIKGYVLGNPTTNANVEKNYDVPYAYGMALISDELYEALKRSCQEEYTNIDPANKQCLQYHEEFTKCTRGIHTAQILEPECGFASPRPHDFFSGRRSLDERISPCASARVNLYRLSYVWLNNDNVCKVLHIRKGSIGEWNRCECRLPYYDTVSSCFEYHVNLSTKGLRSLVYSGDHDMVVTHLGTQAWIRSLNYSIVDDWRPWIVEGQVAGYTRTYSNGMTFATVKGGGHTAPEYKPRECLAMLKRWWLIDHPEFISNCFYVAGDSYASIIVRIITQMIVNGNKAGMEPFINIKGYVLGNPQTNPNVEKNYDVPYTHGMALISDELYEALKISCQGEYTNIDPANKQCLQYHEEFTKCTRGIHTSQILEPECGSDIPRPQEFFNGRRSLDERISTCASARVNLHRLSNVWLNNNNVREALHIRKGSIGEWIRCKCRLPYYETVASSFEYHVNLSTKGLRSLVYSGDHDMFVTHLRTQAWIRSLNYSIVDDWRPWIVEGQVAGYTRTYSNGMTFATVKGGGHTAPEYKPQEFLAMLKI